MTLRIKSAKVQITKALDGRLHVALGLGPVGKPVTLKQVGAR